MLTLHSPRAAPRAAPDHVYVQGLTWNGAKVEGVELAYADLMNGGTLQFSMGAEPAYLSHQEL